jgi:hypothetical protein
MMINLCSCWLDGGYIYALYIPLWMLLGVNISMLGLIIVCTKEQVLTGKDVSTLAGTHVKSCQLV